MGVGGQRYDKLLGKVYNFISSKGSVELNELLKWSQGNDIGPFTLSIILEDLSKRGLVSFEGGSKLVDDLLGGVELPSKIHIVKPKGAPQKAEVKSERKEKQEEVKDDDLYKAIRYLNKYWSVGEIRFASDLQAMGVKDVERTLRELLKLGYITVSELGVINATEKLPKVKTEDSSKELADLLGP